jgi:hypothetical protein
MITPENGWQGTGRWERFSFRRYWPVLAMSIVSTAATAGTIDGVVGVTGPGLGAVEGELLFSNLPNNDNSPGAGGDNALGFDEIVFEKAGAIDIIFGASDSGGITEYSAFASIFNFSQATFKGLELQLGFGSGADFQPVEAGVGLDFDTPDLDPTPSSILLPAVTASSNRLLFEGSEIPFGWVDAIFHSLDVPDGISEFTIRYNPIVEAGIVLIDVDPRSSANELHNPVGPVFVAVLTTSAASGDAVDFDARDVLPRSLRFGPAGATAVSRPRTLDADNDGDTDLLFHFRIEDSGIECGDSMVQITGETSEGESISGTDFVSTTWCW